MERFSGEVRNEEKEGSPSVTVLPIGDRRELLQVELHNGIGKEAYVLLGVTVGYVHYIIFENIGPDLAVSAVEAVTEVTER